MTIRITRAAPLLVRLYRPDRVLSDGHDLRVVAGEVWCQILQCVYLLGHKLMNRAISQ